MSTTTMPETELTQDLDGPAEDSDAIQAAYRTELTRIWDQIRTGATPTYSPEEAIAYARQRLRVRRP